MSAIDIQAKIKSSLDFYSNILQLMGKLLFDNLELCVVVELTEKQIVIYKP